ncbi:unnamed protein product [Rotaria sp. Silwood2]|nr:unnamed protein product [Rotaria sp. Silwood2]CAF4240450.1 unnamed protein product [Rotaria sp. Silwood2]
MATDTLSLLNRIIQSKKAREQHDSLRKLLLLLKDIPINREKVKLRTYLQYQINLIKQSRLLNSDHSEALNNI